MRFSDSFRRDQNRDCTVLMMMSSIVNRLNKVTRDLLVKHTKDFLNLHDVYHIECGQLRITILKIILHILDQNS